jgi:hypothetical protein
MLSEAQKLTALEQDLRRDLEAIERVKKMMAFKNGSLSAPDERQIPLMTLEQDIPETANLADIPSTSLRGTIQSIMCADPSVRWTVQKMVAHLASTGFDLKAQKPVFSVGQAMKKLAESNRIKLVRRGSGSEPHIYRGIDRKAEIDSQSS